MITGDAGERLSLLLPGKDGETRIEYALVRSRRRRRTIGITVDRVEGVVVRAPLRAPARLVEDVVRRKAGWIERVLRRAQDEREEVARRGRGHEERFAGAEGAEALRALKARAQEVLEASVQRWSAVMGCSATRVLAREQKRQWGSCSRDGTLRFNWRLVMAEQPVIDYVVVHELAHLRVRNHSRQFWSAVAAVMPDYAERRKRLRAYDPSG